VSARTAAHAPGPVALLAAGCGTAIASVCALGLAEIQRTLAGAWAVAAVAVAGVLCAVLARTFARLTHVVPSGAGLPAFLSRAFGKRMGLRLSLPYLFLMIALAGIEARIVGALLEIVVGLPVWLGALGFLVLTWAICRSGVRAGYRSQIVGTALLMATLAGLSLVAIAAALCDGRLASTALAGPPSAAVFGAAVGQAFFLFMGFELLTSHVEVAGGASPIARALGRSALALTVFYALLAAGFAALRSPVAEAGGPGWLTPQLALARSTGSVVALWVVVVACLLASYTSFHGALLALSRLVQVLASQGVFPRGLSRVDPERLVPTRALDLLMLLGVAAAAAIDGRRLTLVVLGTAAAAATLQYACAVWAREQPPFREASRTPLARLSAAALAAGLVLLGAGALVDAVLAVSGGGSPGVSVVHAR
jgi:APA family basic amino acid/polyamine antiporter